MRTGFIRILGIEYYNRKRIKPVKNANSANLILTAGSLLYAGTCRAVPQQWKNPQR